jgi:hypothetical protein
MMCAMSDAQHIEDCARHDRKQCARHQYMISVCVILARAGNVFAAHGLFRYPNSLVGHVPH